MSFFYGYWGQLILNWALLAIAGMGFRWTFLAGQFSLGHAALVGVGGYAAAQVALVGGLGVFPAIVLGILAATIVSTLVGLMSLRLAGLFLSIGTLAFGLAAIDMVESIDWLGGPLGLAPPFLVTPLGILVSLGIVVAVSILLDFSRVGSAFRAVNDDPVVAASSGIDTRLVRILSWTLGGVALGLSGGLSALSIGAIGPTDYGFGYLTLLMVAVLVGGAGTAVGPLIGAALVVALPEVIRAVDIDRDVIYGPLILLLVLVRPDGLLPSWPRGIVSTRREMHLPARSRRAVAPAAPVPGVSSIADASGHAVLSVRDVSISFGGIKALQNVSFDIPFGGVHALIGPNGAGKTTLVNIITGALRPDSGQIVFADEDITGLRAFKRARKGLSRTFQAPRLLPQLTLAKNVSVGRWASRAAHPEVDIDELMELMGVADLVSRKVTTLNLAEQRRIEVVRAMATCPKLVLLDEPTAGMNHVEAHELIEAIVQTCERLSITVLLIEHNMGIVMSHADDIVVVSFGKMLAAGRPEEIRNNPDVISAYLGSVA